MTAKRASDSAEIVALARALESQRATDDRLFEDRYARGFLRPFYRRVADLYRAPLLGQAALRAVDWLAPGMRGFCIGRTRFIDDALCDALASGLDQVVILGAGYDSRAYRLAGIERTRVFEVDHPGTQARKRALLPSVIDAKQSHVCFVATDLQREPISERMAAAGFRRGSRTFVVLEGVTEYLCSEAVDAVFRWFADSAAPGSEIGFTYMDRGVLDGEKHFPGTRRLSLSNRFASERISFGMRPDELSEFLAERGLCLLRDAGGEELARRYFIPLARSVRANEYQRTAVARVLEPAESVDGASG